MENLRLQFRSEHFTVKQQTDPNDYEKKPYQQILASISYIKEFNGLYLLETNASKITTKQKSEFIEKEIRVALSL